MSAAKIIYTITDEAPALAELGDLAKTPAANIIKLPNISASVPQLHAAIKELQPQGYDIPDYPEEPRDDAERAINQRYAKVLGSAVNPVLREGNSDRRVAAAVKAFAKKNPHSMGAWSSDSKTHVAHMDDGDFYSSEQSTVIGGGGALRIEHVSADGATAVLREQVPVLAGEVVDASVMNCRALRDVYAKEIEDAKDEGVLFSLHLKATMMKVSDPIMFGHAVTAYYSDVFQKHATLFDELGVDPNNGIGDAYAKIADFPDTQRKEIEADTKAVIPDRCYAGIYQEVIDFCREHGAFDVTTMGNVCNIGLMAQKAEEYGSYDKTFEIVSSGKVRVVDEAGDVLMEHDVEQGDIWRMCQTRDLQIRAWVRLAVTRARATNSTAIFWLDKSRAHDSNLVRKAGAYLKEHDTTDLDIRILSPVDAMRETLQRVKAGKDTIQKKRSNRSSIAETAAPYRF